MSNKDRQDLTQKIPLGLRPHFQEYDLDNLDMERDTNLVIQRTLEFGGWEDMRWLFRVYSKQRIGFYLNQYGERGLSPVTFTYWRKLLDIRKWRKAPFSSVRDELWNP